MATTYSKITYDGKKVQVDSAIRDGNGKQIDTNYQEKLVSGSNIKTINGESLLGSGDITIQGGSSDWVIATDSFINYYNVNINDGYIEILEDLILDFIVPSTAHIIRAFIYKGKYYYDKTTNKSTNIVFSGYYFGNNILGVGMYIHTASTGYRIYISSYGNNCYQDWGGSVINNYQVTTEEINYSNPIASYEYRIMKRN